MNAVPTDKQGVASAVNDATREIGERSASPSPDRRWQRSTPMHWHQISAPSPSRDPRGRYRLAGPMRSKSRISLGRRAPCWRSSPNQHFLDAMDLSLVIASTVLAIAAVVVAFWAPGRDGRQLGFVRGLAARWSAADELGGAVAEHDDRGVRAAAGDGRQDRAVDDP